MRTTTKVLPAHCEVQLPVISAEKMGYAQADIERHAVLGLLSPPKERFDQRTYGEAGVTVGAHLLRVWIVEHGVTQQEVADRIGLPKNTDKDTVSMWCRCIQCPSRANKGKIFKALGIPADAWSKAMP